MAWGYTYRKKITISHTDIDADLTNFPLTVLLSSTNFDFSKVLSTGYDIFFTSSDETSPLYFEKEYFDSTNSKARFHVKVPSVTASVDTDIFMYYGKSDATDSAYHSSSDVWDSNYAGVWHLGDNVADSTGNNNDGTANGTSVIDTDYGKAMSFNGTSNYISVADSSSLDLTTGLSFVALTNPDVNSNILGIMGKFWESDGTTASDSYKMQISATNYFIWADGTNNGTSSNQVVDSDYNAFTIQWGKSVNSGLSRMGLNGTYTNGLTRTTNLTISTTPLYIGAIKYTSTFHYYFDGIMTGIRLSNTSRSNEWIKAETVALKLGLHSIGTEETEIKAQIVNSLFFGMNF